MSTQKELLQELEGYARTANGVEALMAYIARRLHEQHYSDQESHCEPSTLLH